MTGLAIKVVFYPLCFSLCLIHCVSAFASAIFLVQMQCCHTFNDCGCEGWLLMGRVSFCRFLLANVGEPVVFPENHERSRRQRWQAQNAGSHGENPKRETALLQRQRETKVRILPSGDVVQEKTGLRNDGTKNHHAAR